MDKDNLMTILTMTLTKTRRQEEKKLHEGMGGGGQSEKIKIIKLCSKKVILFTITEYYNI